MAINYLRASHDFQPVATSQTCALSRYETISRVLSIRKSYPYRYIPLAIEVTNTDEYDLLLSCGKIIHIGDCNCAPNVYADERVNIGPREVLKLYDFLDDQVKEYGE